MCASASGRQRQSGYALLIMLVILVTGSLYLMLDRFSLSSQRTAQAAQTATALQQAREALLSYAATYRDRKPTFGFGYQPCPDMAGDDAALNMLGTEAGNCGSKDSYAIGLLPYRTLGLPELRDGNGNCLWYAVSGTHKNNPKPTLAPGPDTVAQLEVVDTAGNKLVSISNAAQNGAVAIIIAPGEILAQQNRTLSNKPCATDADQATAYLESLGPQDFVHGLRKNNDAVVISNDQMSWLTAKEVFQLASKRSDYNNNAPLPTP